MPPTSIPTGLTAFHAYVSKNNSGPLVTHHIVQFDVVTLNRGNGYNAFDGIFIVPAIGTYVFSWYFMSDSQGNVCTQLMRNAEILCTRFADSTTFTGWDFATGVVVIDANQGDHVYVRMGQKSLGKVRSVDQGTTTFSGWLLS